MRRTARSALLIASCILLLSGLPSRTHEGPADATRAAAPSGPAVDVPAYPALERQKTSRPEPDLWTAPGVTATPTLSRHVEPSCTGTGTEGPRVQVALVRGASDADTFRADVPRILDRIRDVDDVFAVSAAKTGGGLRVRWVTDDRCVPVIENVVVPDAAMQDWTSFEAALTAHGFTRTDRKYLALTRRSTVCGLGDMTGDDRPVGNTNALGPTLARVDRLCWVQDGLTQSTPAHELAHMLGAVNGSAPHSTGKGHCTDGADLMCYEDDGETAQLVACPEHERSLFDCNNDDYLHMNPPPGSYLATHWNIANSPFLDRVPALGPMPRIQVRATELPGQQVRVRAHSSPQSWVEPVGAPRGCRIASASPGFGKATGVYECLLSRGSQPRFAAHSVADNGRINASSAVLTMRQAPGTIDVEDGRPQAGSTFSARVHMPTTKTRDAWWSIDGTCRLVRTRWGQQVTVRCPPSTTATTATLRVMVRIGWRTIEQSRKFIVAASTTRVRSARRN